MIVYLGGGNVREEDELVGAHVVLIAVRGLEGCGHIIITNNFFTSVKLFMALYERGFYATGTVKKGSKRFPSSLVRLPKQYCLAHGTLIVKMHHNQRISAII